MNYSNEKYELFATCAKGLESLVAKELSDLGVSRIRPLVSGVSFYASFEQICKALLWLRCASRVLLVLGRVGSENVEELYEGCYGLAWEENIVKKKTIAVYTKGVNDALRNTVFTSQKVKDAICDACVDKMGSRPDIDPKNPDIGIHVNLHKRKATISLDLSGKPLHMRGYRGDSKQLSSPIKETLASAILLAGGWKELCFQGMACEDFAFVDPFCGSGTLAMEAAMISGDIAPGILRKNYAVQNWKGFENGIFNDVFSEADSRARAGISQICPIYANDIDAKSLEVAKACAQRAGLLEKIVFISRDISDLNIEDLPNRGLVATNPPYGERMQSFSQLMSIYTALKRFILSSCSAYNTCVIGPEGIPKEIFGVLPRLEIKTKNGPIDANIRAYPSLSEVAPQADFSALDSEGSFEGGFESSFASSFEGGIKSNPTKINKHILQAEQFSNRLAKMAKHRGKWARKNNITCYRVYDADLPEFNVAIDIFEGTGKESGKKWIHVSEYAPAKTVEANVALERLGIAIECIQSQFNVGASDIFLKRRERSKGGCQYSSSTSNRKPKQDKQANNKHANKFDISSGFHMISEGGHLFKVRFDKALDTGIFLDTRDVRKLIEEQALGKSFLNLFAYTASATVYAAAGGAKSTHTIDISNRYLEWARENMSINGFIGKNHTYERADVLQWINKTRHSNTRFDLIYVDAPTFSNSKKMRASSFDIKRDHVEMLIGISRLLSAEGKAIFCCNLRKFKPDIESLAKAKVCIKDISKQTIPIDFERNKNIHHCYIVTRM